MGKSVDSFMSPELSFAIETATEAGKLTLQYFQTGHGFDLKADNSPVTEADRAAERLIRERIEKAFPNHGILGEEEGESGSKVERWVIDPIDGTKSFVAGVPLFGTLLSLERDGQPVVGVVYFPALNEIVYAERGSGAQWNDKPCRVSNVDQLSAAKICCGGHSGMAKSGRSEAINQLAMNVLATRTWCDAYGHMLVATGRVEAMLDPLVKWYDVSAVKIIMEEAGGTFCNFDGGTTFVGEAVSTNGVLTQPILEFFRA